MRSLFTIFSKTQGSLKKPSGWGGALLVAVRDGIIEHEHIAELSDIFRSQEQLLELQAGHDLIWERARSLARRSELAQKCEAELDDELDSG